MLLSFYFQLPIWFALGGLQGHWDEIHICGIYGNDLKKSSETSVSCFGEMIPNDAINGMEIKSENIILPPHLIEQTKNVQYLYMENINLTSIDYNSYCKWKYLETIEASYNNLKKLSNHLLFDCKKLERLNLQNNKISEIAKDAFAGLSSLLFLTLSSNQLTILNENIFHPLINLQHLYLNLNHIQMIDSFLFRYNVKLLFLYLDRNDLRIIPFGSLPKNVYSLEAGENPLRSIDLTHLNKLIRLNVTKTSLNTLSIPSNVETLYARDTPISRIFVQPKNRLTNLHLSNISNLIIKLNT